SCRELTFPSFLFFNGKRLLNHTIKTLQVRDLDECELQCYYEHDCVSINFKNEASKTDGKHTCELNNSTHDSKEQDLVEVKHYFHRGTKNPCSKFPCKTAVECQPVFTTKSSTSFCPLESTTGNFTSEMTMDSVIIAENGFYLCHLKQFLTPAVGSISHWKICYRASKHGRYDFIFHQRCNGKNNTLTIIKKDEYVFGGFTDISWERTERYRETSNAFIFSLRNNEQLGPFKSMVKESSHAIYNWKYTGPAFGKTDIRINYTPRGRTSSSHLGTSYCAPSEVKNPSTVLAGTTKFDPDEVEVFFLKTLN
ncbi:unnamed protein product, partial [Porites lobata]